MRMSRYSMLTAAALSLGLVAPLPAADEPAKKDQPAQEKPAAAAKAEGSDREALFKKLDANGDGQVAADEVSDDQKRLFTRLLRSDKNEDGKLSLEEFLAGTTEDRPERRPESAPEGRRPDGGGPGEAEAIFSRADANNDGKVTLDEVPEDRRERFKQMMERADANGDKALTREEFVRGFMLARGGQPGAPQPGGPRPSGDPQPGDGVFRLLDTDKDGRLSTKELAEAGETIKKLDRDSNGEVSREELAAGLMPPPPPPPARPAAGTPPQGGRFDPQTMLARLKESDKNGDGKWSKDELPERMRENFDRIDQNKDGSVDEAELKQMFAMMARFAGGGGAPGGGEFIDRLIREADKDNDGKLSKDEAPPRMKENFDRIDRNKDGFIDRAEVAQGFGDRRPEQGNPEGRRRPEEGKKPADDKSEKKE